MAIAPTACTCGEPLGLVWETEDRDTKNATVYVGKLVCAAGHSWVDIRPADEPRPHPAAPEEWQRKDPTVAQGKANAKEVGELRNYHVQLAGMPAADHQKNYLASDARVESSGALVIYRPTGPLVIFAAGVWVYCERESQDE